MRRKTWIIAVAIVVLGGALAGGLYWRWANSPRYALQQAALALQARDMDKFFNYLNLKEILNNFGRKSWANLRPNCRENLVHSSPCWPSGVSRSLLEASTKLFNISFKFKYLKNLSMSRA